MHLATELRARENTVRGEGKTHEHGHDGGKRDMLFQVVASCAIGCYEGAGNRLGLGVLVIPVRGQVLLLGRR